MAIFGKKNTLYKCMVSISFCGINLNYKKPVTSTKPSSLAPLKYDTISFCGEAFKKSKLDGFSLSAVEKFKAPIEKFKNQAELNAWAKEETEKILNDKKLDCEPDPIEHREESKKRILEEWKDVLFSPKSEYSKNPSLGLIVLQSITKDLDYKYVTEPPEFDKEIFEKTIEEIEAKIANNRNYTKSGFDFGKQYKENLKTKYINEAKEELGIDKDSNEIFWMAIPSKIDDPENYEQNIKKLKALSSDLWCTTVDYKSREALAENKFYLCIKSNEAKLGVRMCYGKIFDVQGKKNDFHIPYKYAPIMEDFIKEHNFKITDDSKFNHGFKMAKKANDIWNTIPAAIKSCDWEKIMEYMGLEPKRLESGLYEVKNFDCNPEYLDYFKKYGVSAKELLSRIEIIDGDASFRGYPFDTTYNIREIKGNADFTDNKLEKLDKIEKIGGKLNLYDAKITDLGELEYIGGSMNCFGKCALENLGKIKYIGGDACLNGKQLAYIDQLEYAGNMELLENRKAQIG